LILTIVGTEVLVKQEFDFFSCAWFHKGREVGKGVRTFIERLGKGLGSLAEWVIFRGTNAFALSS